MINSVIEKLKSNFTVPMVVYNILGQKLFSVNNFDSAFVFDPPDMNSFKNGIFNDIDKKVTYFLINTATENLYGIIYGVDEVARNFAYILSSLLEKLLEEKNMNANSVLIKDFLTGKSAESPEKIKEETGLADEAIVLLIKTEIKNIGEIYNLLVQFSSDKDLIVILGEDKLAYIKFNDSENNFDNAENLAVLIKDSIKNELLIDAYVSVGDKTENFKDIPYAFGQAECAMKMGLLAGDKNNVFTFKEYLLMQIIEKIDKEHLITYIDTLVPKNREKFFSNYELVNTAQEFLNNDLNLSETSRNAFLHKNTLLYRLDKIEKLTGLNIKRFSDAVSFKLAYVISKVIAGKESQ